MSERVCPTCHGQREVVIDDRPQRSTYPNPNWEPAEPDYQTCWTCGGTGIAP